MSNPFMFCIILNSYLSSMLGHKFHEDAAMQVRTILLSIRNTFTVCKLRKQTKCPFKHKCLPLEIILFYKTK